MTILEFKELTGSDFDCNEASRKYYYECIDPEYNTYPGNKQEYCRDWLVRQLMCMTDVLRDFAKCKHDIEKGSMEEELLNDCKREFALCTFKLNEINVWLGYHQL